ncbi:membrane protein [Clostridia bacterium]|nr:membrane protein [Clostridia bacterium]
MFLFALSEGMHHTRNRKKYLLLLLGASIFMYIAMYLLQERLHVEGVELMNNVFKTLFITGLYIVFYDMLRKGIQAKSVKKILIAIGRMLVPVLVSIGILLVLESLPKFLLIVVMMIPNLLLIEGGFTAVILGLLFYIFRKWRRAQVAALAAFSLLSFLTHNPESGANIQRIMIFAAIPMLLYNGQKGKGRKYFFYVFYPLHIAILYVMAYFLS